MNDKTQQIELQYAIEDNGQPITSLAFRRATVLDLEIMDRQSGNMAKSIAMLSQLTELSPDAIRTMDAEDFGKASDLVAGFLG